MSSEAAVSVIITVILALAGYLITYLNNLRLANRKEQLDLVNRRINEFYGPLFVSTQASLTAYKALLLKLGKDKVFDFDKPEEIPEEKDLAEWRIWLESVFMPLNEFSENLVRENAYLVREEKMPQCLLDLVTHVSAYRATLKKWETGDYSEYAPLIPFPSEVNTYIVKSYQELKAEQLSLIGKKAKPR